MEQHISTYTGGLNKDTAYDSLPPQFYVDAMDIGVTTELGGSNNAVINRQGNKLIHELPNTGEVIIGATSIRDSLFLFTTTNRTESGGAGYIYQMDFNLETKTSTLTLLYDNPDFGFTILHPIDAYGVYETEEIQRIYWVDYVQDFRSLNIKDNFVGQSPTYNGIVPSDLDVFPNAILRNATLLDVTAGGSLTTGVYQYTYKLTTSDGKTSIMAPPSNMIHIVADLESVSQTDEYLGNEQGVTTSKAISVKVDQIDTDKFEFITLIAVIREDFEVTPQILQVETRRVTGSTAEFTHSGNEEGSTTLSFEEYLQQQYPFKTGKTLNSQDELLVVSNTKSESFDIDLDMSTLRYLKNTTNSYYDPIIPSTKYKNPYNNLNTSKDDLDPLNQYKYKLNSNVLGGTGTYVDYEFTLEPYVIDSYGGNSTILRADNPNTTSQELLNDSYNDNNKSFDNMSSPYMSGLYRGYKRGEVYRFGIVFINKKGSPSFVQWIGDIKMPEISDINGTPLANIEGDNIFDFRTCVLKNGNTSYGLALGVQFNVHSLPTSITDKIEGWQIVRVERDLNNMTRVAQGLIQKYHRPDDASYEVTYVNGQNLDQAGANKPEYAIDTVASYIRTVNILSGYGSTGYVPNNVDLGRPSRISFFAPEISYNFNRPPINSRDGLRLTGYYSQAAVQVTENLTSTNVQTGQTKLCDSSVIPTESHIDPITQEDIDESTLASPSFNTFTFDGGTINLKSYCYLYNNAAAAAQTSDVERIGFQGTNLTCLLGSVNRFGLNSTIPVPNAIGSFPIIDYIRYNAEQYGGASEEAIADNTFIAASKFIPKTLQGSTVRVFGGDIFIGMVDILRGFYDSNSATRDLDEDGTAEGIVNRLRLNVIYPAETTINTNLVHGKGVYRGGSGSIDEFNIAEVNNTANGTGNYYLYNDVFSNENDQRTFRVKPINFEENTTNDYRSYYANPKIYGELLDSWAIFGINNFYDVDSRYGPINRILPLRDRLYFLQDTGIGYFAINPRAVINTSEGVPTQLGTGQGFVDHQYISTENGCIHQFGCLATENAIWYLDAINKKVMVMSPGQGVQPISDIKGLHGYLIKNLKGGAVRKREDGGDIPALNMGATMGYDSVNKQVLLTVLGNVDVLNYEAGASYSAGQYILNNSQFYLVDTDFTNSSPAIEIGSNSNITLQVDKSGISTFNEGFTLEFSEMAQIFSTFRPFKPHIYVQREGIYFTPNPVGTQNLYTHTIGNFGQYYDNEPTEAYITLCVNANGDINKILRFIEFNSTIRDINGNIDDTSTITAFRITNSDLNGQYQDSGKIFFDSGRIKRRFRKWRIKLPRDINSKNQAGRFRDTWFFVTLYFNNQNNKELVLNKIVSHYDIQMY